MRTNVLFLLLSLLCLCWTAKAGRKKRNVLELGGVISCVTGLSPFDVLWKLDGYGCYCGLGGQGTAKDDVDDCCRLHDECYDVVMHNGVCPENTAYTTIYHYTGKDCKTPQSMISCDPASSYDEPELACCAVKLCECDHALAQCLKGKPFNNDYRKYDKKTCTI